MNEMKIGYRNPMLLLIMIFLTANNMQIAFAQERRWLRIGELQSFFTARGTEVEGEGPDNVMNFFYWPAQYGLEQTTVRSKAMWLGCKNFYDTVEGKTKSFKVVGMGPREDAGWGSQIFPKEIKLFGKYKRSEIVVDEQPGTFLAVYDILDEVDETLIADRMIVIKFNTSMGISVTKKVLAFAQENHDNYFINEYVLKNTGIIDQAGNIYEQTLEDVWIYFLHRYTLSGESVLGYNQGWGSFGSSWGVNTVNHVIGTDPSAADFRMRGFYSWYGPSMDRPVSYDEDWGCPNQVEDGVMSSAKYVGCVTLHADKDTDDQSDDLYQPKTTVYHSSDHEITSSSMNQYDEVFMGKRYSMMSAGHPDTTHGDAVGENYAEVFPENTGGGISQGQGFGPYNLNFGDSIRIVFGEGAGGLSRQKNREVGANWIQYYKGAGSPELIMPDGSVTSNHNAYKRAWVETGIDSILKTYRNVLNNYLSGYSVPQPPPPPDTFTVQSGSDLISLTWSDNATNWPHFDGYVIYRSEESVMAPKTVYQKIFECDATNVVHRFDDTTANPGFDYYYTIQSKDDGLTNDVKPGVPLYSGMFYTMTSVPAYLRSTYAEESNNGSGLSYRLDQNYPNPFNPSTTIRFSLQKSEYITLKLFDLLGKEIETIFSGSCPAGENEIGWQPKELSSGIYIYQLQAGNFQEKKKMIFFK